MVLEGAGWNRKEFPESNLHVCSKDDTKIGLYNMGRCTKKGGSEKIKDFGEQDCALLYNFIIQQDNII